MTGYDEDRIQLNHLLDCDANRRMRVRVTLPLQKPEAPKGPSCFGDLYYASLPKGHPSRLAPTPHRERELEAARSREASGAIAAWFDSRQWPDLVRAVDVVEMLPPHISELQPNRDKLYLAVTLMLRARGARRLGLRSSSVGAAWALRNFELYFPGHRRRKVDMAAIRAVLASTK